MELNYTPPPDLFVLRRANWKFINGTSRRPAMLNWLLFLFLFTFLNIFPVMFFIMDFQAGRDLAQSGHNVQGTIIDKEWKDKGGQSITYRFTAETGNQQGQTFTQKQEVKGDVYDQIQVNSRVSVVYLPRDPRTSRLAGKDADLAFNNEPIKLILLGGVVLNVLLIFVAFSQSRRNWRLARTGQIIPGQLTSFHLNDNMDMPTVSVKYSFVSPTGSALTGKDSTRKASSDYEDGDNPQPGTPVAVLYADDRWFKIL